jgi:NTP pyrophosphatase (non-canonical NTP hydrolase)
MDIRLFQKESVIAALRRFKITIQDLFNPDYAKFIRAIRAEVMEAEASAMAEDFETRIENGKVEGFYSELADIVIICLTLAECGKVDLGKEIENKIAFNKERKD